MRAGASTGRGRGALSAAMLRNTSAAGSLAAAAGAGGLGREWAARKPSRRLRGPSADSGSEPDELSPELVTATATGGGRGGRGVEAGCRRAMPGASALCGARCCCCCCCCCWAAECLRGRGERAAGGEALRCALSELPRVTNETGGPRDRARPWALCEAVVDDGGAGRWRAVAVRWCARDGRRGWSGKAPRVGMACGFSWGVASGRCAGNAGTAHGC